MVKVLTDAALFEEKAEEDEEEDVEEISDSEENEGKTCRSGWS
jgi:hypothetical protein